MKNLLFLFILFSCPFVFIAQTAPNKYWVEFTDKSNTPYSIENPEEFMTQRAIDRREKYKIEFNSDDLPIDPEYINSLLSLGKVYLVNQSKWFNAVTVFCADSLLVSTFDDLPFVNQVKSVQQYSNTKKKAIKKEAILEHPQNKNEYGESWEQINMLGLHMLHELGYNGQNIQVGIMDAGFSRTNQLPALDRLYRENRLKLTRDFVLSPDHNIYQYSSHGTSVLSIAAAYQKDSLIGSGFMADYYLFRTEDSSQENLIEEDNWVSAVEYADYLGLDIVNTSLGYSNFEDSLASHTYEDMDGNTTRISIAMKIASSKGILPVTSAGNEGDDPWRFITAPGDADSCLTIGAVDKDGVHAGFSSFGPSFDGRVKPDIAAMGQGTAFARQDSTISRGNGTSFSAPLIAGAIACLWQAHPSKSNHEIMDAVRQSSHLYSNPNDSLGYGIPNFWIAHEILSGGFNFNQNQGIHLTVYPNPFIDHINIQIEDLDIENFELNLMDLHGKLLYTDQNLFPFGDLNLRSLNEEIQNLSAGFYLLEIIINGASYIEKIEKIE